MADVAVLPRMRSSRFVHVFGNLLLLILCASAIAAQAAPAMQTLTVPYLTSRAVALDAAGTLRYSTDLTSLSGGRCRVSVPSEAGDKPRFLHAEADSVATTLSSFGEGPVLFYIHGYNIGFERACEHAARLAVQTGFEEQLLLFSWPASTTMVTYRKDEVAFLASAPAILQALELLVSEYGAAAVNVLAHSMGSRITLEAVDGELALPRGEKLRRLLLVAPDLPREAFVDAVPALRELFQEISVLVSDRDHLLRLSQLVNRNSRLGQADDAEIPGVEVTDVSELEDEGYNGHMYHLTSDQVGGILRKLLQN